MSANVYTLEGRGVDRMRHTLAFTVNSREEGATNEEDGEDFDSKEHISEYRPLCFGRLANVYFSGSSR